jgi:hypothetical protein
MPDNVRDAIRAVTGGRPFVFVIMAYDRRWTVFEAIRKVLFDHCGLATVRADDFHAAGHDLLEKIQTAIGEAELVIAEISEPNPNVFYEVGYARGIGEAPILLVERPSMVPSNLLGMEVVVYDLNNRASAKQLEHKLVQNVQRRLNLNLGLLRDMLEAPEPRPGFMIGTLKYWTPRDVGPSSCVYATRSFGDGLGIVRLLSAFGSMWGDTGGIELLPAPMSPPDLATRDVNLYLLGSSMTTPQTGEILNRLQAGRFPNFSFGIRRPNSGEPDEENILFRGTEALEAERHASLTGVDGKRIWSEDHGILVRGPHPNHSGRRMALVLAGAHGLGTGAACFAATSVDKLADIRHMVGADNLANKDCTLWALVKGKVADMDGMLYGKDVTVEAAGVYQ